MEVQSTRIYRFSKKIDEKIENMEKKRANEFNQFKIETGQLYENQMSRIGSQFDMFVKEGKLSESKIDS